jgi:hypothetical protein
MITNRKPFQLLTSEGSAAGYGSSADRLVLMVLRVMEESVPHFGDDLDDEFGSDLDVGNLPQNADANDSDCDSDSDSDCDSDSDSDSDGGFDSDSECDDEEEEDFDFEEECPGDGAGDGDNDSDSDDPSDHLSEVPEDERFCISLSPEQIKAAKVLAGAAKAKMSRSRLLEAYRRLIFAVFTSLPSDAKSDPFKSPMEAFLIARGLKFNESFRSAHEMAPGFSKVQYLGMFSILDEVCRAENMEE